MGRTVAEASRDYKRGLAAADPGARPGVGESAQEGEEQDRDTRKENRFHICTPLIYFFYRWNGGIALTASLFPGRVHNFSYPYYYRKGP